eukprot:scaffold81478_cov75-Phaeocystis_antarctica.AAC.2
MPWPIRPSPTTPTRLISGAVENRRCDRAIALMVRMITGFRAERRRGKFGGPKGDKKRPLQRRLEEVLTNGNTCYHDQ